MQYTVIPIIRIHLPLENAPPTTNVCITTILTKKVMSQR